VVLALTIGRVGAVQQRRYPRPAAAPVVGYRGSTAGQAGLEAAYDAQLLGLDQLGPGDSLLRKFRPDPYDPSDLYLSIDIRLQELAERLLAGDRGAIVAIEPATGRLLAVVTSPSFDPNRLVDPSTGRAAMDELRADPVGPFLNRASQGLYPPGSVFKVVTAIAGLESGAIRSRTRYASQPRESRAGLRVDGLRIRDAPRRVQLDHPLDLAEAMEISSNVWFAHAGLDTGTSALRAAADRLGIGSALELDLPTARTQLNGGTGPLDGFANRAELATAAFGQGGVLVTPLQMALVVAAVANDGVAMHPKLVDRLVSENGEVRVLDPWARGRAMSSGTARIVRLAMTRAVEGPFAAGYAGGADVDGMTVAGKSGSAELGSGQRPHSWFVGFAPVDEPAVAIAVVVENGGFGSERAVPLGGRLLAAWLTRLG
jgi:peptidoglycan glycosyltransferase